MITNQNIRLFAFIILLLFCTGSGLVMSGCERKEESGIDQQKSEMTIGTSFSVNAALLFLAEKNGNFEQQGLKINLKQYPSAAAGLDDMLNDKIEIAAVAETPLAFKSLERADFSIFATIWTSDNDPKVIVRKSSGILNPRQLLGKTIGSTKKGQSAHFFLHLFLLRHGFQYHQVNIIHDSPKNLIEKLKKGELPAAVLFEPHVQLASRELGEDALVFTEPGLYFKTFNLVAKNSTLEKHYQEVENILRALYNSGIFLNKNQQKSIDYLHELFSISDTPVQHFFEQSSYELTLSQSLLISMQEQAIWAMKNNYVKTTELPDFKRYIFPDALKKIHPESITILSDQLVDHEN